MQKYLVWDFDGTLGYHMGGWSAALQEPHPQAFHNVLDAIGNAEAVWMIGDSMAADILGAESVGMPAILVRKQLKEAKHCCQELSEVAAIINRAF